LATFTWIKEKFIISHKYVVKIHTMDKKYAPHFDKPAIASAKMGYWMVLGAKCLKMLLPFLHYDSFISLEMKNLGSLPHFVHPVHSKEKLIQNVSDSFKIENVSAITAIEVEELLSELLNTDMLTTSASRILNPRQITDFQDRLENFIDDLNNKHLPKNYVPSKLPNTEFGNKVDNYMKRVQIEHLKNTKKTLHDVSDQRNVLLDQPPIENIKFEKNKTEGFKIEQKTSNKTYSLKNEDKPKIPHKKIMEKEKYESFDNKLESYMKQLRAREDLKITPLPVIDASDQENSLLDNKSIQTPTNLIENPKSSETEDKPTPRSSQKTKLKVEKYQNNLDNFNLKIEVNKTQLFLENPKQQKETYTTEKENLSFQPGLHKDVQRSDLNAKT
jgi:hypothetical protein